MPRSLSWFGLFSCPNLREREIQTIRKLPQETHPRGTYIAADLLAIGDDAPFILMSADEMTGALLRTTATTSAKPDGSRRPLPCGGPHEGLSRRESPPQWHSMPSERRTGAVDGEILLAGGAESPPLPSSAEGLSSAALSAGAQGARLPSNSSRSS